MNKEKLTFTKYDNFRGTNIIKVAIHKLIIGRDDITR